MKVVDEKKLRKSLAKALSHEVGKQVKNQVDECDPQVCVVVEKLVQEEAERVLDVKAITPNRLLENSDGVMVFRAPISDKPFHLSVDGLGNAFRDTLRGLQPRDAISRNVQVKVEFAWKF